MPPKGRVKRARASGVNTRSSRAATWEVIWKGDPSKSKLLLPVLQARSQARQSHVLDVTQAEDGVLNIQWEGPRTYGAAMSFVTLALKAARIKGCWEVRAAPDSQFTKRVLGDTQVAPTPTQVTRGRSPAASRPGSARQVSRRSIVTGLIAWLCSMRWQAASAHYRRMALSHGRRSYHGTSTPGARGGFCPGPTPLVVLM